MLSINAPAKASARDGKTTNVLKKKTFDAQPHEFAPTPGPWDCGQATLLRCLTGLVLRLGNALSPLVRRDNDVHPLLGLAAGFDGIQKPLPARRPGMDRP